MSNLSNPETIAFLNYAHNELIKHRILIILSIESPRVAKELIHYVHLQVENFQLQQTKDYACKLIKNEIPDSFVTQLQRRTNGNPRFIRDTLIDLTERKIIWRNNKFDFNTDLSKYKLTEFLQKSIARRYQFISDEYEDFLKMISVIYPPMTSGIIAHVLQIPEKDVFFFLNSSYPSSSSN